MKKLIRIMFALVFSLASFALVACDTKEEPVVLSAEEAIKVLLVEQETYVTGDFDVTGTLFYKGTSYPLTWTSNNTCLAVSAEVNANGNYTIKATRPESEKQTATLTASLTIGEQTAKKDFTFNLYPIDVYEISDAYKFAKANKAVKEGFDLETEFTYEGKKATIAWSVPEAYAQYLSIENNKVVFDEPTENIPVQIVATFTYNGKEAKRPFSLTLIPETVGPTVVTEFEDGDSFKFGLYQESLGKYLYLTGKMNGFYFETTEKASEAADVTVHVVEGGYQLTVEVEGTTKYIEIIVSGQHNNVKFNDAPTSGVVWQWNTELNTFTLDLVNTEKPEKSGVNMLGTSGTYNTLSANVITKKDAYVGHLYQLPLGPLATPVAGVPYKLGFYQGANGEHLYFTGAMNGYYFATTNNPAEALDVTAETTEGGFHLSFVNAENKKQYIELKPSGKHTNVVMVDTPSNVWKWDATHYTYIMTVTNTENPDKSGDYFLGTYGTNVTIGASAYSYITNDTNYICHMYAPGAELPKTEVEGGGSGEGSGEDTPTYVVETKAPVAGVAYKLGLVQENLNNKLLFVNGTMSDFYYGSTEDVAAACDVYLEATDGGFHMYLMVSGTKKYMNIVASNEHINVVYEAAASSVWTYDAAYNTMITDLDGTNYFLGTRNDKTYNTFSACAYKYSSNFKAHFYSLG